MRYSFYRNELQYINKKIFSCKLKGIPKNTLPLMFVRSKLYKTDVIDFDKNKKPVIEGVYRPLFESWTETNKIIKFKTTLDELDVVAYNKNHIITVEEDGFLCDVGYFLYEEFGLKKYLMDKLNAHTNIPFDQSMSFKIVLTEDEFERFMDGDESFLTGLSEIHNIHKSVFKKMIGALLNRDMVKYVATYNSDTHEAKAMCIYIGKSENYMYKKIYSNNANCYIISICDCNTIISEIIE
jgi:hypothetical protein